MGVSCNRAVLICLVLIGTLVPFFSYDPVALATYQDKLAPKSKASLEDRNRATLLALEMLTSEEPQIWIWDVTGGRSYSMSEAIGLVRSALESPGEVPIAYHLVQVGKRWILIPSALGMIIHDPQVVLAFHGVTGGTGSIGSQLVTALAQREDVRRIQVLTRPGRGLGWGKEGHALIQERVAELSGDLSNVQQMEKLVSGNEVVYHLAGWSGLGKMDPKEALLVNSLSTAILSLLANMHERRIVFASTGIVYLLGAQMEGVVSERTFRIRGDVQGWLNLAIPAFKEYAQKVIARQTAVPPLEFVNAHLQANPIPQGVNIYALSKLLAEQFIVSCRWGVALRFSNVYGPGDETERIVSLKLREFAKGLDPVKFIPGGKKSYIYVADVVRALIAAGAMEIEPGKNQIINVNHPQPVSANHLVSLIGKVMGSHARIEPYSDEEMKERELKPGTDLILDVSLMESELGLRNLKGLAEGLAETIAWFFAPDRPHKYDLNRRKENQEILLGI